MKRIRQALKEPRETLRAAVASGIPTVAPTLIVLAAASIGLTIGWSTGQAGLDSDVLAAVLPVILTGVAGGAGLAVHKITITRREVPGEAKDADRRLVILASGIVIAFSTAYLVGTIVGRKVSESAQTEKERGTLVEFVQAERDGISWRYDYLVRCTRKLARLNSIRERSNAERDGLNLEPLTFGQVCIGLVRGASSERPLAALADARAVLKLPHQTEKRHYEFLDTCSLNQSAANSHAVANGLATVTIGKVCPALVESLETTGQR